MEHSPLAERCGLLKARGDTISSRRVVSGGLVSGRSCSDGDRRFTRRRSDVDRRRCHRLRSRKRCAAYRVPKARSRARASCGGSAQMGCERYRCRGPERKRYGYRGPYSLAVSAQSMLRGSSAPTGQTVQN